MQKYQSHKVVEAAQVLGFTANGVLVREGDTHAVNVPVPNDFFARGTPAEGDYLVRYQPDCDLSWSPKAVFEAGYTLVPPSDDCTVQHHNG